MKLKILSWNIWIDGYYDKITDYIQHSDADIIGLQEVKDDDPNLDVINYLKKLGYEYKYAPIEHEWGGIIYRHGPAIFSKYPISSYNEYNLHDKDNRKLLQTDVDIKGHKLHIFNTHLTHTHQKESEVQLEQAKNIMKHIGNSSTLLMGDFNAIPSSTTIKEISSALVNLNKENKPTWCVYERGCGICLHDKVDIALDYIFTSRDVKGGDFTVGNSKGSDHLPVETYIEI